MSSDADAAIYRERLAEQIAQVRSELDKLAHALDRLATIPSPTFGHVRLLVDRKDTLREMAYEFREAFAATL